MNPARIVIGGIVAAIFGYLDYRIWSGLFAAAHAKNAFDFLLYGILGYLFGIGFGVFTIIGVGVFLWGLFD